jgi:chain length determinant protein EpsF
MTLRKLLRILVARKLSIVVTMLVVIAAVEIAMLVIPPKYTATASVVISSVTSDAVAGGQPQAQVGNSYVSTQISIIESLGIAREMVAKLSLNKDPQYIAMWSEDPVGNGDMREWLANLLLKDVKVEPARQSNVVEVNYSSRDPAMAAKIANGFAQAYLEASARIKSGPANQATQFFQTQIAQARQRLEAAQLRLSDAAKANGIVMSPDRLDVENSRLADLSTQLALAHAQRAESSSRRSGAASDNATSPDVIQNGVIQQLKGEIAQRESQLSDLGGRLGDRHPQYLRMKEEIAHMREGLSSESARVGSSLAAADRISAQKVGQLQASVNEQRQRILHASEARDKLSVMQREVDSAQHDYELVMQRDTETKLQSEIRQSDAGLLAAAVPPAAPSFPRVRLFTAMAIALGFMLGVAVALMRDMMNPRFYGAEDLMALTGVAVFSVVPRGHRGGAFPLLGGHGGIRRLRNNAIAANGAGS